MFCQKTSTDSNLHVVTQLEGCQTNPVNGFVIIQTVQHRTNRQHDRVVYRVVLNKDKSP